MKQSLIKNRNNSNKKKKIQTKLKELVRSLFVYKSSEVFNLLVGLMLLFIGAIMYWKFENATTSKNSNTIRMLQKDMTKYMLPLHKLCKTYKLYHILPAINQTMVLYMGGAKLLLKNGGRTREYMGLFLASIYISKYYGNYLGMINPLTPRVIEQTADRVFNDQLLTRLANFDDSAKPLRLLASITQGRIIEPVSKTLARNIRTNIYEPILLVLLQCMQQGLVQVTPKGLHFIHTLYSSVRSRVLPNKAQTKRLT
mgnify:CR=1 FL=1